MNKLLELTFESRGYTNEFLDDIMTCNHKIPRDIPLLCTKLKEFYLSQKLIVVLTDFDLDGICAGVIGYGGLTELGFNVALYLPNVSNGYGFTRKTIDEIKADYPDVACILTGDVGISCHDAIRYAKQLGITMLITDHHKGEGSPYADVVVDPCRVVDTESYSHICGANVMYQTLRYYAEHFVEYNRGFYMEQIDRLRVFAGLGTISDSMPLYYENRPMVRDAVAISRALYDDGHSRMMNYIQGSNIYRCIFAGLQELFLMFAEAGKIRLTEDIDETFFGYYVAPMFNSVKRMNGDISEAYYVFFGANERAKDALAYLFDLNEQRKQLVAEKLNDIVCEKYLQPWKPYAYITDAPAGICGLLAQQMMLLTGLPTLVVRSTDNGYAGSGRSPVWFPFLECGLRETYCHWWAAGHNPAFGFGCPSDDAMDEAIDYIKSQVVKLKPADDDLKVVPDFVISEFDDGDVSLDLRMISYYLSERELCRPFGTGFPVPYSEFRFASKNVIWSVIGKDKSHLKLVFSNEVVVLLFNQAYKIGALIDKKTGAIDTSALPERIIVRGDWGMNHFNDINTLQFHGDWINIDDEFVIDTDEDTDEMESEVFDDVC